MKIQVVTEPSTEPVTLVEAKMHLNLLTTDTSEDTLLSSLITSARQYCEAVTGRAFAPQTVELYLDGFPLRPFLELPMPPLQSVSSVVYVDEAGTITTLTEDTDYIVDDESPIGGIVLPPGVTWLSGHLYPVNPIKIRFIAGYQAAPEAIKLAILLLVGHWYENREAVYFAAGATTNKTSKAIEFGVRALLATEKVKWF